jgi:hypothetical protein
MARHDQGDSQPTTEHGPTDRARDAQPDQQDDAENDWHGSGVGGAATLERPDGGDDEPDRVDPENDPPEASAESLRLGELRAARGLGLLQRRVDLGRVVSGVDQLLAEGFGGVPGAVLAKVGLDFRPHGRGLLLTGPADGPGDRIGSEAGVR